MRYEEIATLLPHLRLSSRSTPTQRRRLSQQCCNGEVMRLFSGVYIPARVLAPYVDNPSAITLLRSAAAQAKHPIHILLSGTSAALAWEFPLLTPPETPHLTVLTPVHPLPFTFPALVVPRASTGTARYGNVQGEYSPPIEYCAITVRPHRPRGNKNLEVYGQAGLALTSVADTTVECLLTLPREDAFVAACAGLRKLTNFKNYRLEESRRRERYYRAQLLNMIQDLPRNTVGRAQASKVLARADAGCESPGESRLLYLLQNAHLGHATRIVIQHRILTDGGTFFMDLALPDYRLAIEFDGRGKYGNNVRLIHRAIEEEQRRQRFIEAEGWHMLRVRWEALDRPEELIAHIRACIGR